MDTQSPETRHPCRVDTVSPDLQAGLTTGGEKVSPDDIEVPEQARTARQRHWEDLMNAAAVEVDAAVRGWRAAWPMRGTRPPAMPAGWEIREYRGAGACSALAHEWDLVYSEIEHPCMYHLREAHDAFFANLCDHPDIARCLVVHDGRRVRAICPLEARKDSLLGVGVPVWGLPFHDHWPVNDIICPEDEVRPFVLPAITDHLRRRPERRPLLMIGPSPEHSALWSSLSAMQPTRYCADVPEASGVFDCTRPVEELLGLLTTRFARNVRRLERRLGEVDGIRFASTTTTADGLDEYEQFLEVEASGWKGEGGAESAIKLNPRVHAFYRQLVESLGDDGCHLNSLYVGDECVASQFCIRTGPEYTLLKICYDQEFSRVGPGQNMLLHAMRKCCADPTIERMNLVSHGGWQDDWGPGLVPLKRAYLALDRWLAPELIALTRLRLGYARRIARWARAVQEDRREAARATEAAVDHVATGGSGTR